MDEILYEFEMILIGKRAAFSQYLFNEDAEDRALKVIEFAFNNYLKWSERTIIKKINWNILMLLRIDTLMRYIDVPPNLDNEDYTVIILSKMYPQLLQIDNDEYTIKSFKNSINKNIYKIPNNYLSKTEEGRHRAIICLQYTINDYMKDISSKDLYNFFTMTKCKNMLKKYCLNVTCNDFYEYPIDFLHEAMPKTEENEFWYRYYKLKTVLSEEQKTKKQIDKYKI